jgi:hypothetical protein
MPVTIEIDDVRRRVTITFTGEFQLAEARATVERERQNRDDYDSYGVLCDTRRMTGRATVDELKRYIAAAPQPAPGGRRHGAMAVLATDPAIYSMACAYMALGAATRKIEVFNELREAERWLSEETSSTA